MNLGDYDAATVIYGKFTTYRPSTGATFTLAGTPALSVYKDNSTTQSVAGITLTADFDSVTGLNHFAIDTSADGSFYAAGSNFDVVITTGTIDGVSVTGSVVGRFSLRKTSIGVGLQSAKIFGYGNNANLLTQTEDHNLSPWQYDDCSVMANQALAPNGSYIADKLLETTANADHTAWQPISGLADSTEYSFSVYLKAAERAFALVWVANKAGDTAYVYVNLTTGATANAGGACYVSHPAPVDAGNGWWRCGVRFNSGTGGGTPFGGYAPAQSTSGGSQTYVGTATSGIYAWGAQLEAGSVTTYTPKPETYGARFEVDLDATISSRLAPTVSGRTLDVTTTGESGVDWANVGAPTTTVNLSGTTIKTATDVETDTQDIQGRIPAALVSGRIDASVGAMAANVITATAINADAITDAKVAADVTIASVTGAVGSVTGAVGSVTGAVGSVTGNVGGNVVGSVASVTADVGITQAGADKVWASAARTLTSFGTLVADTATAIWGAATRLLTAGTNIVLAKGVGVTGFNDLSAAEVNAEADTALLDVGVTSTVTGRVDVAVSTRLASAGYTAPDNADIVAIKVVTDKVNDTLQQDGNSPLRYQFTSGALELAPTGGSAPTAATIADAVWDEARAGHVAGGSFGEGVASVQGSVAGSVASVTADVGITQAGADKAWGTATRVLTAGTNIALAKGVGVTGFNDLDAAGVRGAVGLASANLDTQLTGISAVTIKLNDTLQQDGNSPLRYQFTLGALELAPTGGSAPSAATIADAVWDEARAGHVAAGSFGEGAASVQGSVTGSIGSLATQAKADVNAEADTALADAGVTTTVTGRIDAAISTRLATAGYTVPPTVGAIADAAWDEAIAGHLGVGSTGKALNDATAAGNPWSATLEGSLTAGDILRVVGGVAAGKTDVVAGGGGAATVTFRDLSDASDIVVAQMQDSERTTVTLAP